MKGVQFSWEQKASKATSWKAFFVGGENKGRKAVYSDFALIHLFFPVNDTMDEIFDDSADEEEQDAIVSKVLDEIGIEISGKVSALSSTISSCCR